MLVPAALTCALLLVQPAPESPAFERLQQHFEYDRARDAHVTLTLRSNGDGVKVYNFSFDSPVEGRVPGLLVVPDGKGRFPVILYGHWMMRGSPLRSKDEFLAEAMVMASAGAMAILLDSPLVRRPMPEETDPMEGRGPLAQVQMVKEWRTALDIVLARPDADPARIAFVGHSFSAGVGAKLTALDKRIGSFVLMANQFSLREFIYDPHNPVMVEERTKRGANWVEQYLKKFPFDDSRPFAERSAPAAVFLQFGRKDPPLPPSAARLSFARFAEPKRMEFYDAGHELDAAARVDRAKWLAGRLQLRAPDTAALNRIPQLH
jgi:cephalosporin-C deacetylase-like acetyl esterase